MYFLSVSTFDEYPETNIHRLKTKGVIVNLNWENDTAVDSAKLNLVFNKYTSEVLKSNNLLQNKEEIVTITVTSSRISESIKTVD